MYYVYVLQNNTSNKWYIGYTSNLRQIISDHNNSKGGKTTRQGISWKLIYYEAYLNKGDATGREIFLKSGSGYRLLNKQLFHYLNLKK